VGANELSRKMLWIPIAMGEAFYDKKLVDSKLDDLRKNFEDNT
jgi:hypothetical protein